MACNKICQEGNYLFKAFYYITPYLLVVFQFGFFLGHAVYFNQHQIEGPLLCINMEKKHVRS